MTDNNHSITPPPELVQQWWDGTHGALYEFEAVATQAARWGSDQELDACCEWLIAHYWKAASEQLRATRRPKPPSLKEQALTQLDSLHADLKTHGLGTNTDTIRRALEQLND